MSSFLKLFAPIYCHSTTKEILSFPPSPPKKDFHNNKAPWGGGGENPLPPPCPVLLSCLRLHEGREEEGGGRETFLMPEITGKIPPLPLPPSQTVFLPVLPDFLTVEDTQKKNLKRYFDYKVFTQKDDFLMVFCMRYAIWQHCFLPPSPVMW